MVIIENRFQEMQSKTGYNPRKINSSSKLSHCIQREQSKFILVLPTNNCHVEIFGKTLSGGSSCVNTRLLFDTDLLMPNLIEKDFDKMNIDQSFKAFKRDDLKLVYKVKFDNQKKHEKKRVVTKILKLGENNQYGYFFIYFILFSLYLQLTYYYLFTHKKNLCIASTVIT